MTQSPAARPPGPGAACGSARGLSRRWSAALGTVLLGCGGLGGATGPGDPATVRAGAIAFVGVHVIPMTDAAVLDDQTVIVRDGVVERIVARDAEPLPADATVIAGRGRYLMPALADMHVHLRRADLPAYLRAGIATVRNMWGHSGIPPLMADIERGAVAGPAVYSAGPGLDGTPPRWPETRVITDPLEADAVVAEVAASGFRVMKVYQSLTLPVYDAIMEAVHRRGLIAIGHVPTAVPVRHALEAGQHSIEHLTGYDRAVSRQGLIGTWGWVDVDAAQFGPLAEATAAAGTWNCPTLSIYIRLSQQQHSAGDAAAIAANRRQFVLELFRKRAPLLAGTDAGIDVVAPGTSLFDELEELVRAGLTPYQALRTATVEAGRYLGVAGLGTLVPGAPANLLLLDANPVAGISSIRRTAGLVLRGTWYSSAALGEM